MPPEVKYPPFVACLDCGRLHFAISQEEHRENRRKLAELREVLPHLPARARPSRDATRCSNCGSQRMRPASQDEVRKLKGGTVIHQVVWPPRLIQL